MRKKSFQIALAAVSCSLATMFTVMGMYIPFAFATGYLLAACSLMLPLAVGMGVAGGLAYLATVLLSLLFGGVAQFYKLFPFIAFFGLHPLANYLQKKYKINKWLALAIKTIWFVGTAEVAWLIFSGVTEVALPYEWMYDWIYLLIGIAAVLFFILYDWLIQRCQQTVNSIIIRKVGRSSKKSAPPVEHNIDDVFEETLPNTDEEKNEQNKDDSQDGEKH